MFSIIADLHTGSDNFSYLQIDRLIQQKNISISLPEYHKIYSTYHKYLTYTLVFFETDKLQTLKHNLKYVPPILHILSQIEQIQAPHHECCLQSSLLPAQYSTPRRVASSTAANTISSAFYTFLQHLPLTPPPG